MASSYSATCTKFLKAARSGDLRLVKKLAAELDDGGEGTLDKIRDIQGYTALHFSAIAGNIDVCKYLVKQLKLDVNAQDVEGVTPLIHATLMGRLQMATYLLDNGADIVKTSNRGITAIHYAALIGRTDFLQLFISRGAEVDACSERMTPLACATSHGNREVVEVLLQNNANPNAVAPELAATPILVSSFISLEITDLLVKAGADPNENLNGRTPLHSAVEGQKVEIIMYLLKAGANPNVYDSDGITPLEHAAMSRSMEAVTILFPVTSPISYVPDWSIDGLMRYVASKEAEEKITLINKQNYVMGKSKGEEAFKIKDYNTAIFWYTRAIAADPYDAKVLSNRSLCYARLNLGSQALSDAKDCVRLRHDWSKAHYREGVAWKLLKNYEEAIKSFSCALKLDPNNQEIQKAMREAVEAQIAAMRI